MAILIDDSPVRPFLPGNATLADALAWVQCQLPDGKIITHIQLDDLPLEGDTLAQARSIVIADRRLAVATANRKELALGMLGKLAALIEWLGPQHREVAALLERGDAAGAFPRLGGIFSAWHQIQQSYSGLARLLGIVMSELPVREVTADQIMQDFCRSLADMQKALQNRDLVMLADILQYEMDGAVANWMAVLESTLGIIEPEAAAA